ncbi:hypothetical protein [Larkinella rosea]|uniref:Tetratricopeptide repeat protein n=1 Tax=Larkinella rosea TaxID=2025312 RepID=A0A3P1BV33_9BACT|nr:hypothetical protein [Larkinella rosea]RRB04424.1 hypothetical protein EHT25_13060 [Larkinella rosea]
MKLTEDQYELIEAYLKNELSAPDRASFETDIQSDAALLAEVGRQRDLRLGLRALGIQHVLEQARTNYKTALPAAEPAPKRLAVFRTFAAWPSWVAAASVVVVLGVGYYAYQQTAGRQTDLAYNEAFRSDSDLMKGFPAETVPAETRITFLDAFKNYKAGKYDRVIEQLKTLPTDKQTIHYKNYLLGLSYLANHQPTESIPLLTKAQETPSPELHRKAEWFLALAYVKTNQKEQAVPILNRISTNKANPFQSLAQRVLQKIQ